MLLYLNDIPEEHGGTTVFPRLNITIQPKSYTALYWKNLYSNGTGHPSALHAGRPIIGNYTKWAINCWIRTPLEVEDY